MARLRKENHDLKEIIGVFALERKRGKNQRAREIAQHMKMTKKQMAQKLWVSRSSLYYRPKRPPHDLATRELIEKIMREHLAYGHRKIALELRMNHTKVRRIMVRF
jgi:hypothetical protein